MWFTFFLFTLSIALLSLLVVIAYKTNTYFRIHVVDFWYRIYWVPNSSPLAFRNYILLQQPFRSAVIPGFPQIITTETTPLQKSTFHSNLEHQLFFTLDKQQQYLEQVFESLHWQIQKLIQKQIMNSLQDATLRGTILQQSTLFVYEMVAKLVFGFYFGLDAKQDATLLVQLAQQYLYLIKTRWSNRFGISKVFLNQRLLYWRCKPLMQHALHQRSTTKSVAWYLKTLQLVEDNEDSLLQLLFSHASHQIDRIASTTSFVLWSIAKSNTIQKKLRQEVDSVFQSEFALLIEESELNSLSFCQSLIKETIRFYSPILIVRNRLIPPFHLHELLYGPNSSEFLAERFVKSKTLPPVYGINKLDMKIIVMICCMMIKKGRVEFDDSIYEKDSLVTIETTADAICYPKDLKLRFIPR